MFETRGSRRRRLVVAAAAATTVTAAWELVDQVPLGVGGYIARALALIGVAALIALLTEQRAKLGADAARWFQMSSDLLCTASVEGRLIAVNLAWTDLLGYPREELIGRALNDFVHPNDLEKTRRAVAVLGKPGGTLTDFENRFRAADGSWHWLSWSARSDEARVYAVARDVSERKRADIEREELLERVKKLAQTDELTGITNRAAWHARLKQELDRANRGGHSLAVVLIDLDHFKALNDSQGHAAGDRVLKHCAAGWLDAIRGSDVLGRIGGDEFALLLPDCDFEGAKEVLERLRGAMPGDTTCSMGVAVWDRTETPGRLLLRADRGLYTAKRLGRNRVASFSQAR
jgi:diguanylate cyclase (GGDEF)-like protein/PAS domain S-box-containing protein